MLIVVKSICITLLFNARVHTCISTYSIRYADEYAKDETRLRNSTFTSRTFNHTLDCANVNIVCNLTLTSPYIAV